MNRFAVALLIIAQAAKKPTPNALNQATGDEALVVAWGARLEIKSPAVQFVTYRLA